MKSHKDENSNDIEQVKSVIKSNKGDTVIHAKGDYKQRVADIGAGKDIEVVAKSIEVLADYNSGSKHTDNKDAKLGQFTKVSSPIIDAVNAIEGAVNSDASDKVKTLQGISAAATTYQAVSAVQNGATLAKVESGIGFKTAKSQQDSSYEKAQDNKFTAGGNIRLVSTEKDIRLQNTKAKAEQTIELDSARDIVLESGKSSQKADGKNSSVGVEVGVGASVGVQTGVYAYAEVGASKGSNHLDASTHELTSLEANHLITKSKGDTTLTGAKGIANRIDTKVGGKLKIESVQDQVEQDSKQSSVGGRAQIAIGSAWDVSGNFSQDKTNGSYKGVAEQSGFVAGNGGYHVDADEVELKGGAIVSTADKKNNDLTTNKLTHSNIENKMDYDVSSVSISANLSSPSVTPSLPTLEKGKDSNTTLATLSEGNITVGGKKTTTQELGINSDAAAGNKQLGKLPDLASKLEEKKIITQATSNIVATTKQISSDIATKAEKKQDELKKEYQDQLPEQEQQAFNNLSAAEQDAQLAQKNPEYAKLKQDKQDWGIGGQKRQTLDVVTGIVTGALGGQGLTQIATNAAAPYVANTISNTFGDNAEYPNKAAQLLSHAVLGAVVAYNNGGSAAAGAVSGSGSELAADYLLKTLHPGKEKQELNEQEKQQLKGLANSVAAVAGGLAGNSAANVAIAAVVADNAVEHNALFNRTVDKDLTPDQQQIVKIARDAGVYDINDLLKENSACENDSCRKGIQQKHEEQTSANAKIISNLYKQGKLTKEQVEQLVGGQIAKKYAEAADKLERSKYFGYSPETKETFDWGSPAANGEVFKDIIHDWRESAGADKTATKALDLLTSIYNPNSAVQILDEINEGKRLPLLPRLPKFAPKTDIPKNTTNPNVQKIDNKEQLKTSTKPDVKNPEVKAKPEVVNNPTSKPDVPLRKQHVLDGEVKVVEGNKNGTGGHYSRGKNIKIDKEIAGADKNGIVKVEISVRDPATGKFVQKLKSNGRPQETTLFPKNWSKRQTETEINSAYKNSTTHPTDSKKWRGYSDSGVPMEGYYKSQNTDGYSAYPIHLGNKTKPKGW